jgi:hypothetical protein
VADVQEENSMSFSEEGQGVVKWSSLTYGEKLIVLCSIECRPQTFTLFIIFLKLLGQLKPNLVEMFIG